MAPAVFFLLCMKVLDTQNAQLATVTDPGVQFLQNLNWTVDTDTASVRWQTHDGIKMLTSWL